MTMPRTPAKPVRPRHVVVASLLSAAMSVAIVYFGHVGPVGPAGPAGMSKVVTEPAPASAVCEFYGWDAKDKISRVQIYTPAKDANGVWCPRGTLIQVLPVVRNG